MQARDGIRFDGVFTSPELEAAYRLWHAADDVRRARLTVLIALATLLVFAAADVFFLGYNFHSGLILGIRIVITSVTLFVLFWLARPRAPVAVDRVLLAWLVMLAVAVVYQACSRPASYTSHAVLNVLYVILMYAIIPLPWRWQVIPPLLVTFGVLTLGNWVNPWPDLPTLVVTVVGLVLANVAGGETSRQLHHWKRRQFRALSSESDARRNLEHALAEIKTLRGILPICTHCKRIWNDAGFWEQVEVYVRNHTHAEFSHGLCPTCARQHYPEIDWEKKGL
jgi:hypothetical protein